MIEVDEHLVNFVVGIVSTAILAIVGLLFKLTLQFNTLNAKFDVYEKHILSLLEKSLGLQED